MKCAQAERWMDAALDELEGLPADPRLVAGRRAELDLHLAACARCRQQWEALRSAEAALRVPRPAAAPEDLLAEFRQRLAQESPAVIQPVQEPRRKMGFWSWLWPLGSLTAAGAAATAVLVFGIQVPPPTGKTETPPVDPMQLGIPSSAATQPLARQGDGQRMAGTEAMSPGVVTGATDRHATKIKSTVTPPERPSPRTSVAARPQPGKGAGVRLHGKRVQTAAKSREGVEVVNRQEMAELGLEARSDLAMVTEAERLFRQLSPNATNLGKSPIIPERQLAGAEQAGAPLFGRYLDRKQEMLYFQVAAEPPPVELDVSPAVLTALQRPVEVSATEAPVAEIAERLAEAADVLVRVDPKVAQTTITVAKTNGPLWQVLENVARQGQLEIYPRDNGLVLRQGAAASRGTALAAKPDLTALKRQALPKAKAAAPPPSPSPPPAPTGAKPGAFVNSQIARAVQATPDRKVWPAAWGNLPERGFEVPSPTELPAMILVPVAPVEQRAPAAPGSTAPARETAPPPPQKSP